MSAKNPNPPVHREAIGRMTELGYSIRQISEQLGVSERCVNRNRSALGIAKEPVRKFTQEEHERALEMLADGVSIPEISRTIGRSKGHLWKRYRGMSEGRSLCDSIKLRRQLGLELT